MEEKNGVEENIPPGAVKVTPLVIRLKKLCPKCKIGEMFPRYCEGCHKHLPERTADGLVRERYLNLKIKFCKDNGIPLDENFNGDIGAPICPSCHGVNCHSCSKCNHTGRLHTKDTSNWEILLKKAENELPGKARAELINEGVDLDKIPTKEEAMHWDCGTCGYCLIEKIG